MEELLKKAQQPGFSSSNSPKEYFQISPNPVTQVSTITYHLDYAAKTAFVIYDLQGKVIRQISATSTKDGQIQLNKKDLPNGIYIISLVEDGSELPSKKFVIMD